MGGFYRIGVLLAALLAAMAAGCGVLVEHSASKPADKTITSPLLKSNLPPDAVTFDILMIRVPYQERALLEELWGDVDEQEVDPETCARLTENGIRAGILGATVPESLSTLMSLKGRALRQTVEENLPTDTDTSRPVTLSKVETLRPGNKCVIATLDEPVEKIPVLSTGPGGVMGKVYENAETKLSVMIRPVPDGSVSFEITPFLTFGEPQIVTKYKYSQMFRGVDQPTKTFDELTCHLPLRPGQFLVIGPDSTRQSGLGHYFFAQGAGDFEQQIVVIRLLFTQHDERFYHFPGFTEIIEKKMREEEAQGRKDSDARTDGEAASFVSEKQTGEDGGEAVF
ncbi:MAG: hypothetical protein IKE64_05355 [Thermoguttaceae bacterium]|nr:hypothetical protein [Thermoguttaceae bacterium]